MCTQGPSAQFSARLDLVLGHGARARFLARALEKKCVHISAQQESYSGTSGRAPSVNKALDMESFQEELSAPGVLAAMKEFPDTFLPLFCHTPEVVTTAESLDGLLIVKTCWVNQSSY